MEEEDVVLQRERGLRVRDEGLARVQVDDLFTAFWFENKAASRSSNFTNIFS